MRRVTPDGVSRREVLAGVAGSFAVAGCIEARGDRPAGDGQDPGSGGGDGPITGSVQIAGSSTVFPLSETMRVEFLNEYDRADVSVSSTGTGAGFGNYFCTGRTVINDASRRIKDSEVAKCADNGIEAIPLRVATDALTVVVNKEADWVDCLTVEELAEIWGPDGAERWSDVREEWPDEEFTLFGPATTSGTFDYFTEAIMGEEDSHRSDYQPTEDDNTIVTGVSGSQYTMGYLGFAHYQGHSDAIKAVAVEDPETATGCVKPSLETASEGQYTPLSRPLFIYVAKGALADPTVRQFCRFYIKHATSRKLVAESVGYVPLTETQQAEQFGRLELAIDDVLSQS